MSARAKELLEEARELGFSLKDAAAYAKDRLKQENKGRKARDAKYENDNASRRRRSK